MKKAIKLEQWSVLESFNHVHREICFQHLYGIPNGHPRLPDGHCVTTSPVIGQRDGMVITKSGSVYELGTPAADYAARYPDAHARLFAALPEVTSRKKNS